MTLLLLIACGDPDPPDDGPTQPSTPSTGDTGTPPTEPTPPEPLGVDVQIVDLPLTVHGKAFRVALDRAAAPTLTCTSPEVADELHVVDGVAGTSQELELHGLLAGTRYDCAVTAEDGAWTGAFRTDPADPELPGLELLVDRGDADGAWTVLNHWVNGAPGLDRVLVVDRAGRVRWSWTLDQGTLSDVDVSWVPEEQAFLVGGGSGYAPRFVRLDGSTGWTAPGPEGSGWYHHHTERLADGAVLSLATERGDWDGEVFESVQIEVRDPLTDLVSWAWHGQDALLAGSLPPPTGAGDEPWHANAVILADDADGPAAFVSFKWLNRFSRIDRATGAVSWQLGRGGDFALVDAGGVALPDEEWFYGQHDPEWDAALERLLVYDNGSGRPGSDPPYSRVLELRVDRAARTASPVWSWTEPGWYEPLYGGVDRLPGGHVLVAMGHCACVAEVLDHRSAVVEVDPADGEVVWRLELASPQDGLYRASRIDGCALFAHRGYCPSP